MELAFHRQVVHTKAVSGCIGVVLFTVMTALGGFVRIPLPYSPVPVTLQTFFVLLSGACLGRSRSTASQFGYLALGAAGCPVFAQAASGAAYLAGPTGGYLAGFVVAAWVAGSAASRAAKFWQLCAVFFLADALILSVGMARLTHVCGYTLSQGFMLGFVPFVPGDIGKALAAAMVYWPIRHRGDRIFSITQQ